MEKVSSRIAALAESQTIAMSQKSRDLIAQGIDVINLSVGEPDFFTPDFIKEAAKKAIDENYSFYPPVAGYKDLLEAISGKLKRENGLDYKTDQIVVSAGAKHSLSNVLLSLVNAGDEVIVPAPYWVSYVELIKLAEGKSVVLETGIDTDFKITPEQLEKAITPKSKVFMLCSPSNPTGSVYSRDELLAIARVLEKHPDIFIISDEIYEHINFIGKHESIAQFDFIRDRVIIINGVSKGYAMTGWRLGFLASAKWIAKACSKLQGQQTSGVCSIAQKAAVAAFNSNGESTVKMKEAFQRRRDLMVDGISAIKGFRLNKPQGAFYIFPEVSDILGKSFNGEPIKTSNDLAMYLLNQAHVAVVPGSAFGAPNYVRFSYATSDEKLKEAIVRIRKAIDQLK
ncbi:MAG TPA: pyridoxal phosphate-dependent aminotransferase [Tenuifilaceae bacterium]|mgnify:CR=1 FL=1|nr:pyridoxal phosphate-dependent aminotransferase [Tenuifilaceae bacterium]